MLSFLRSNLAWMIVAVGISSTLWATVASQQSPEVASFLGGVPIELQDKPASLVVTSPLPTVNIDVRTPLDSLSRLLPSTFRAHVDLSGALPGTQEFPVKVDSTDRRVHVDKLTPDKVTVRLEAIKKKDVPVRLNVTDSPPFGYVARPAKVTPDRVTVVGPEGAVDQVIAVAVDVHLDNARASLAQPYKPIALDAGGAHLKDVTTTPENVLVEVAIEQQLSYKALAIAPQLSGSVALGYQIIGMVVDPTVATVVGDPNVLETTPFLSTNTIDVAGATGDRVVTSEIVLPNGVSQVRRQPITVRVYVSPVEANKVVRVVPQIKGLGSKLTAELNPNAVDVTVSGPMPLLSSLRAQELQVAIDATDARVGTTTPITVTATVPAPLRVDAVAPRQVSLVLRASP